MEINCQQERNKTMIAYREHTDPIRMNSERAAWALKAIRAYANIVGSFDDKEAFGDLLADMRHLADGMGWSFTEALDRARQNYAAERLEDGPKAMLPCVLAIVDGKS
jgi:hypothetical protein